MVKFVFGPWWLVAGAMAADAIHEHRKEKKAQEKQLAQLLPGVTPEKRKEWAAENETIKRLNAQAKTYGRKDKEAISESDKKGGSPF